MSFDHPQKVLFKHCDPAGMVFYPRFFEMINDTVEAFFAECGLPFDRLHKANAIPTVAIATEFMAPCRLGDDLNLTLSCTKLGRTSLGLRVAARGADGPRFEAQSTIVFTKLGGQPTPWPDPLRTEFSRHLEETKT